MHSYIKNIKIIFWCIPTIKMIYFQCISIVKIISNVFLYQKSISNSFQQSKIIFIAFYLYIMFNAFCPPDFKKQSNFEKKKKMPIFFIKKVLQDDLSLVISFVNPLSSNWRIELWIILPFTVRKIRVLMRFTRNLLSFHFSY